MQGIVLKMEPGAQYLIPKGQRADLNETTVGIHQHNEGECEIGGEVLAGGAWRGWHL